MRRSRIPISVMLAAVIVFASIAAYAQMRERRMNMAGRRIAFMYGCADCHTHNYFMKSGNVPESEWLAGDNIGWRGPWGTTYPANLRLLVQNMTEDDWVKMLHSMKARPPMPWWSVNALNEREARSLYRYIKGLGPKGGEAPAYVPPDKEPATEFYIFAPQKPNKKM